MPPTFRKSWVGGIIRYTRRPTPSAAATTMEIRERRSGKLLWQVEGDTLARADLRNAKLRNADLARTDLGNADLRGADLRGADLHGADLNGARLDGANLRGADLRFTTLRHLQYDPSTRWPLFFRHPYPGRKPPRWWEFWKRRTRRKKRGRRE